eukprot:COSAG04_NODE_44_length_31776_cov_9.320769_13_plen_149_part_00
MAVESRQRGAMVKGKARKGSGGKGSQGKGSAGVKGGTGSKGGKGSKGAKGKGGKGMKGGKGGGTAVEDIEDIYDEPLDDDVVDQVEQEQLAEALAVSIEMKAQDPQDDGQAQDLNEQWKELSVMLIFPPCCHPETGPDTCALRRTIRR